MYILYRMEIMMVNYNKLMEKLKEKGITTYTIRQKALIPQSTLTKLKMCSGDSMEEIRKMSRNHAGTLVDRGFKIIGWDYIDIREDF